MTTIAIDIETVPCVERFDLLSPALQALWLKKQKENETFEMHAGLYPEFGKVACISFGYSREKIKSFSGPDESEILIAFCQAVASFKGAYVFAGHNILDFDFPFLAKRYLINKLPIPRIFNVLQGKPWDNANIDTMKLWAMGVFNSKTSLNLLCAILGVESPKQDIDGSQVADVFYKEQDYARIARYCEADVLAVLEILPIVRLK
jgi:DNA polymerase elongation subunit (family B)